jgi:hypothetical protein
MNIEELWNRFAFSLLANKMIRTLILTAFFMNSITYFGQL